MKKTFILIAYFIFLNITFLHKLVSKNIDFIIVNKSLREMNTLYKGELVKNYKISLGFEPIGKKIKRGDGKTPEGLYYIEEKLKSSAFFLSLKISYPNPWDIRRALEQDLHPGGQIMIHGYPNKGYDKNYHNIKNDWTEGCIAISNIQIANLWRYVKVGTPILIRK